MTKKTLYLLFLTLVFTFPVTADFRAAISCRNVTPDPLLPVSGGVGPSQASVKALGELNVRALVLEGEDKTRVAFVSADFLGFPSTLCNQVRAQVKDISPENILIGSTHTHSAPDCYGFPNEKGEVVYHEKYLTFVCKQMADAVNEAVSNLQPCVMKIATGEAKGKIAYNYYAERLYDPRCNVIQALDRNGKAIATLVNYAIHPEVIGSDQGILSPDLIGPLYSRIQEQGGGTGIFMNGAQGGMVTADCRGGDGRDIQNWDECKRIGNLLADEALRIVKNAPVQESPKLYCAAKTVSFPIESLLMLQIVKLSPLRKALNQDGSISTTVNLVNLGNAQILTIPGEALPNIGYYLKRKMHGQSNFLFGLTNDAFGYILTKEDFDSFERYEYISRTSLGEMTGDIFINEALEFVNQCPKPIPIKE